MPSPAKMQLDLDNPDASSIRELSGTQIQKKKAKRKERAAMLNFAKGIFYLGIYLGVGCWYYNSKEKWSYLDCLYFSSVTFTTIGYGDLRPENSRLFTIAYIFFGIIFVFGLLQGQLGDFIMAHQDALAMDAIARLKKSSQSTVEKRKHKETKKVDDLSDVNKCYRNAKMCYIYMKTWMYKPILYSLIVADKVFTFADWINKTIDEWLPGRALFVKRYFQCLVPLFVYCWLGSFIGLYEGWTFWESIYFAATTVTTVGYGDMAPSSPTGRALCIVYCPMSVLVLTNTGLKIGQLMQKMRFSKLTLKDLLGMDQDGDGRITENEFTCAILVSMGKVRETTLQLIHHQFRFLDKESKGYLDGSVVHSLADLQVTSLNDLIDLDDSVLEERAQSPAEGLAGSAGRSGPPSFGNSSVAQGTSAIAKERRLII